MAGVGAEAAAVESASVYVEGLMAETTWDQLGRKGGREGGREGDVRSGG